MDVFLARQPIFDRNMNVYAYELLFRRGGGQNFFDAGDQEQASTAVLTNGFFSMDILQVASGKRVFVNFTQELLLSGLAHLLPKELLTVEILETVEPVPAVVQACKKLAAAGYSLALDDFVFAKKFLPLIELADIIKVDFMNSTRQQRARLFGGQVPTSIKMLAEKVETQAMFDEAVTLGCVYFQGYFFSKPVILSGKNISHSQMARLQLLQEIKKGELEWANLEDIFRREVGLSYKLLKYINSPVFGLRGEVASISHAMKLLGQQEMVKWLTLMVFRALGEKNPDEIMATAVIRARFGELLAQQIEMPVAPATVFLTGLFSLLDVFLGLSMRDIAREIQIDAKVRAVLTGESGPATDLHRLLLAYEQGDWLTVASLATQFGVQPSDVAKAYGESLVWYNRFLAVDV
jgi:EAL and modified HD-GYP domain-containing signal transduction protein